MHEQIVRVPLHRVAHSRAGDKGNRLNISLICYDPEAWQWIESQVTASVVLKQFSARSPSHVMRYLLPQLSAMNFVIDSVLEGGVNRSLSLDRHGKTLSFQLLDLMIEIPMNLIKRPLLSTSEL